MKRNLHIVASFLLILTLIGCGATSQPPAPPASAPPAASHPAPVEPPTAPKTAPQAPPASAPPAVAHPAPVDPPAAPKTAPQPESVKLVPIEPSWGLRFHLLHPEGWQVHPTALGDMVEIFGPSGKISVRLTQLRGQAPPQTAAEMKAAATTWAPDVSVKEVQIAGAARAFELQYTQQKADEAYTVLEIQTFGQTYREELSCEVRSEVYAAWQPILRQIVQSYVPSNLNADPLPGRP